MLILALSPEAVTPDYEGSISSSYFNTSNSGAGVRGARSTLTAWNIAPKVGQVLTTTGNSIVFGWAMKINALGAYQLANINTASSIACSLYTDSSGHVILKFSSTGSVLATSSATPFVSGAFSYIEIKIEYVASTTCNITIRVDGVTVITGSYTIAFNANTITGVNLDSGINGFYSMDFYCLDTSGANNNDFLGDCRVEHLIATSEGANTGWTSSTSDKVNDVITPTGGDGNYIRTTTSNNRQTFVMTDPVNTTGTVKGVQVISRAHGENNGVQKVAGVVRVAGTSYNASDYGLASNSAGTYSPCVSTFEKSPATSADWTMAELAALEAGVVVLP